MNLEVNQYQTPIEDLNLDNYDVEIQEQFDDFINNVPFIRTLIDPHRPRAKDLPRDEYGKIIVDITKPHILEDMDYFRPTAITYQKTGKYTHLRPNANPNSEFGKWIREEIRRCFEGYVRESDGEWVTGDYYYFLNYAPMSVAVRDKVNKNKSKRVIDFPRVWEGHYLKFHYIEQARNEGHHCGELASRSKGKAHPYSQKVYTPEGEKLWGDLKIGDYVFGDDGKKTKIIDIPYDQYSNIYKVTLCDGRTLFCTLGHLFKVRDSRKGKNNKVSIRSLEDILKDDYYHTRESGKKESYISIPSNLGVEFEEKETKIDPYTLGMLLGDGCFRTNYTNVVMFTSREEDISTYKKYCPYDIYKLNGKYDYRISISEVGKTLKEYGLFGTKSDSKFIPKEYLFNSKKVRLNVLKGLLDTDGTVNNNGIPMITTTLKKLCDDIIWLCRSLGYNTRVFTKQGKFYDKICKINYNISILTNDPIFNLERKLSKLTTFPSSYSKARRDWTHIIDISFSHKEMAKCITVDNSSHCYLIGDFITTHNSYSVASLLSKRFILGESYDVNKKVTCYITAAEKKYLVAGDQTLDKFQFNIDWCAQNTEFPSRRLISSLTNMQWKMGYHDMDTGTDRGTLNSVIGITSKDDESKLRGSRGVLYVLEEWGSFPRLLELYNNLRPSVEDGEDVFGLIIGIGTAGDSQSDFSSAQEIMYNPRGYNMHALPNVYDKEGQGKREFVFFFPGYLNRAGCYDENGNSDVTKAILQILVDRWTVKHNSTDINSITKRIAEIPIVPQEAILRTTGNMFPVTQINDRINQLDNNPHSFDDSHVGELFLNKSGIVEFKPTNEQPIRNFPHKDNKLKGAIEIFQMPEKDRDGKVYANRYILGHDPVDDDSADTMSLTSTFVLDLWTDNIVAEYTGRQNFADDNFEIVRMLCLFYNGKCLYENNKKGLYAYFSRMNCLYLLADTPEYLRDKDLIKGSPLGNKSKGVNAVASINNYANDLIRDWLLIPKPILVKEGDEIVESSIPNLYNIKSRALLKELSLYNPDINVDRIRALGMVMLYREEKMILYNGNPKNYQDKERDSNYLGNDPFFTNNYDNRYRQ